MFYTVYKTTNLINGKFYIGKHQTKDLNDGYVGSGKRLKYAIRKYGPENFVTDILFVFDEEWKMNLAEKILVVPDIETNYNLCPGGKGGFGYVNENGLNLIGAGIPENAKKAHQTVRERRAANTTYDEEFRSLQAEKWKLSREAISRKYPNGTRLGMKNSEESKRLVGEKNSVHQSGTKNSQYGTCWITNGEENKKIKKEDIDSWISQGYRRGRMKYGRLAQ